MIKSLELTTDHYSLPVMMIRTDGVNVQVVSDITDGAMREPKNMEDLRSMVASSSHLRIKESPDPKMVHHVLSNNDVLSVSEDGLTACLNGHMLADQEKAKLLELIDKGVIKMQGVETT